MFIQDTFNLKHAIKHHLRIYLSKGYLGCCSSLKHSTAGDINELRSYHRRSAIAWVNAHGFIQVKDDCFVVLYVK